jgi:hypothetical protein
MRKYLTLVSLLLASLTAHATQVHARLVGADGGPLVGAYLTADLNGCATTQGPTTLAGNAGLEVQTHSVIRPGKGGLVINSLVGNDQLLCNGVPNTTYWQISSYNGTTLVWQRPYVISGSTWDFDDPSHYPAMTVAPVTPLQIPVITNSATSQTVSQTAGSIFTFQANVTVDGNFNVNGQITGNFQGNALTARQLASDPTDCIGSNTFAYQIDTSGNLTCKTISWAQIQGVPNFPTSIQGTANQVIVNGVNGIYTLSLPQAIEPHLEPHLRECSGQPDWQCTDGNPGRKCNPASGHANGLSCRPDGG